MLSGAAPTMNQLIWLRAFQGIGTGAVMPLPSSFTQESNGASKASPTLNAKPPLLGGFAFNVGETAQITVYYRYLVTIVIL